MNVPPSHTYCTSGLFGQPGPSTSNADPAAYLVPTNNNYDKDTTGGKRDYEWSTVLGGRKGTGVIFIGGPARSSASAEK